MRVLIFVGRSAPRPVFELPFQAFQDQVVRFLDAEIVELYDNPRAWGRTQTFVAERPMEMRA